MSKILLETSMKGTMDPEGARLLTLLYAYRKPRLCINIHQYAPPRTVLEQAQAAQCRASCCSRPLRC